MTVDTKRLREMAEARRDGCGHCDPPSILCNDCMRNVDAFDGEIDHKTIIALLDEVERFHAALAQRFLDVGELNQQLAAANAEIERLRAKVDGHRYNAQVDRDAYLKQEQQLAAMTAARDEALALCERGWYRDARDVQFRIAELRKVGAK